MCILYECEWVFDPLSQNLDAQPRSCYQRELCFNHSNGETQKNWLLVERGMWNECMRQHVCRLRRGREQFAHFLQKCCDATPIAIELLEWSKAKYFRKFWKFYNDTSVSPVGRCHVLSNIKSRWENLFLMLIGAKIDFSINI